MKREPCAAIDLGTNTALLLVARLDADGRLEVVEDHCLTPRLGSRTSAGGTLDPAACERALAALEFFAQRLVALRVARDSTRAVGTAALRRARDAADFVSRARQRTGLEIEILSPEEEARLGQVAIAGEGAGREALVLDVGGGSTEVACPELGLRLSVPVGAVVLTEAFLGPAPSEPGGFAALWARARAAVQPFPAGAARGRPVFALGGTGLNLACLARGLPRFDHRAVEGALVEAALASVFAERLGACPLAERLRLPIEPERAEILPAGLACLAAACERLCAKELRVSGRGLRFGVVRDLLARAQA